MRKIFTVFLLAAMMCVLVCGCSSIPDEPGETPSDIVTEIKETEAAAPVLLYIEDTNVVEPVEPVIDTPAWSMDYMTIMQESCLNGDLEAGRAAEADRNAKISALNLEEPEIGFDDLYELSKVITNEAGSYWLPMEWKMMVGEVVLNRVSSKEFPDTITEVIHQKGQYSGANTKRFEDLVPFADCVEAASRLLCGERIINDSSVVFQANFRQGSGTYLKLYDKYCGYTYLCYSNYPELYEIDEQEEIWRFF